MDPMLIILAKICAISSPAYDHIIQYAYKCIFYVRIGLFNR